MTIALKSKCDVPDMRDEIMGHVLGCGVMKAGYKFNPWFGIRDY